MLLRRSFLLSVAGGALALAGCSGTNTGGTVTLQDIVNQIKEQCKYQTDWQNIAAVVVTVLAGFNAAAGQATAVAAAIANQVVTLVCNAVQTTLAEKKGAMAPAKLVVVVNGVTVTGDYLGH